MAKIKKREIRKSLEDALREMLVQLKLSVTSKRVKKLIRDASKEIGDQLAEEQKKKSKKSK